MDLKEAYECLYIKRRRLARVKKWTPTNTQKINEIEIEIDELENLLLRDRVKRMKTLDNHGIHYIAQDEEIYAVGDYHPIADKHTWENVTTLNLKEWLGYPSC